MTKTISLLILLVILLGCNNQELIPQPVNNPDDRSLQVNKIKQKQDSQQDLKVQQTINQSEDEQNNSKTQDIQDKITDNLDPCLDTYDKPTCYLDYALKINDKTYCEKAGYKKHECYDLFLLNEAVAKRDKLLCVDIINEEIKDVCYYKIKNN
jgi:hypothetical protein